MHFILYICTCVKKIWWLDVAQYLASVTDVLGVPAPAGATSSRMGDHPGS